MSGTKRSGRRRKLVKIGLCAAGIIIAVTGMVFAVIGFINFSDEDNNLRFAGFMGVSLIIVGAFLFLFSFQREWSRYKKGDGSDMFGTSIETNSDNMTMVMLQEHSEEATVVCECGTVNRQEARYCKKCGKSLHKVCAYCGEEIDADSEYCDKCGKRTGDDEKQ